MSSYNNLHLFPLKTSEIWKGSYERKSPRNSMPTRGVVGISTWSPRCWWRTTPISERLRWFVTNSGITPHAQIFGRFSRKRVSAAWSVFSSTYTRTCSSFVRHFRHHAPPSQPPPPILWVTRNTTSRAYRSESFVSIITRWVKLSCYYLKRTRSNIRS